MASTLNFDLKIPPALAAAMLELSRNLKKYKEFSDRFAQESTRQTTPSQPVKGAAQSIVSKIRSLFNAMNPMINKLHTVITRSNFRMIQRLGSRAKTFIRTLVMPNSMFAGTRNLLRYLAASRIGMLVPGVGWFFTIGFFAFEAVKWLYDKTIGLIDNLIKDYNDALMMGSTVGGVRALPVALWFMPSDPSLMSFLKTARSDITSNEAQTLYGFFGVKRSYDINVDLFNVLIAAQRFIAQNKGEEFAMIHALMRGGMSNQTALALLQEKDPQRLRSALDRYIKERRMFEIDPRDSKNIFQMKLAAYVASITIQDAAIHALVKTGLAASLTKLADSLSNMLRNMINNSDATSKTSSKTPAPEKEAKIDTKRVAYAAIKLEQTTGGLTETSNNLKKQNADLTEKLATIGPVLPQLLNYLQGWWSSGRGGGGSGRGYRGGGGSAGGGGAGGRVIYTPVRLPTSAADAPESIEEGIRKGNIRGGGGGASVPGGPLTSGPLPRGKVPAKALYDALVKRFSSSPLNGFVPGDGARYGIVTGSPQEWARLTLALAKQESSLNSNESNGGLYQFNPGDLQNYGLGGRDPHDPNVSMEAMARQLEKYVIPSGNIGGRGTGPGTYDGWRGGAAYFEPLRYPQELDKHLGTDRGPIIPGTLQPFTLEDIPHGTLQQPSTAPGALPPGGDLLRQPVTSPYIGRGLSSDHQGVDVYAPNLSPLFSPGPGKVIEYNPSGTRQSGQPGTAGGVTVIKLDHGDGNFYVVYMHNGMLPGKVGAHVQAGEQIGVTGIANGVPHVHVEVWYGRPWRAGSIRYDPMKVFGWTPGKGGNLPVGGALVHPELAPRPADQPADTSAPQPARESSVSPASDKSNAVASYAEKESSGGKGDKLTHDGLNNIRIHNDSNASVQFALNGGGSLNPMTQAASPPNICPGKYIGNSMTVQPNQADHVTRDQPPNADAVGGKNISPLVRGYIRGLGQSESGFSREEAYSDKYNQLSNNKNVKALGWPGKDYGYYQMNETDVDYAVNTLHMPPGVAQHLAGGWDHQNSSVAEQTMAVNEYMKRRWPDAYKKLAETGDWQGFRKTAGRMWSGPWDHPQAMIEEMNNVMTASTTAFSTWKLMKSIHRQGQLALQ